MAMLLLFIGERRARLSAAMTVPNVTRPVPGAIVIEEGDPKVMPPVALTPMNVFPAPETVIGLRFALIT